MLRVVSVWTGKAGSPWYSTTYFEGSTSVDAQEAVDNLRVFLTDVSSAQVTPIVTRVEPFVASVSEATGEVIGGFVVDPGADIQANGTGNMVPAAAQVLAQLRTGAYVGGREIKGKIFLPGFKATNSDANGRLPAAAATALGESWTPMLVGTKGLLVYSRKNRQSFPVASISVSPEFAILTSRRD